jgi:hypothetical protein
MKIIQKISAFLLLVFGAVLLLSFISLFHGCSFTSPLFSTRDNKASIVLEKPPLRILLSGEYSQIDVDNIIKIMEELRKHKYYNYKFNNTIIIDSEHATIHDDSYNVKYKNKKQEIKLD